MHATFIPYLRYRSEVVNSDPLILVFHDVIDDAEISEIKDLAFGKVSLLVITVDLTVVAVICQFNKCKHLHLQCLRLAGLISTSVADTWSTTFLD